MAMNKKEQKEMEDLKWELKIVGALRFTEPVAPDLPLGKSDEFRKGYSFNEYNGTVFPACSTKHYHSTYSQEETSIQRGIDIYSTRLLAMKALRCEMERKFAIELAKVDEKIAAEAAATVIPQ